MRGKIVYWEPLYLISIYNQHPYMRQPPTIEHEPSLGLPQTSDKIKPLAFADQVVSIVSGGDGTEASSEDIENMIQFLIYNSKCKPNPDGYWKGWYTLSPETVQSFLSSKELAILINTYYNNTAHYSNYDDHSYYYTHTNRIDIVFHNSDTRHRCDPEEIDAMDDVEKKIYFTLSQREKETGRHSLQKLTGISILLH